MTRSDIIEQSQHFTSQWSLYASSIKLAWSLINLVRITNISNSTIFHLSSNCTLVSLSINSSPLFIKLYSNVTFLSNLNIPFKHLPENPAAEASASAEPQIFFDNSHVFLSWGFEKVGSLPFFPHPAILQYFFLNLFILSTSWAFITSMWRLFLTYAATSSAGLASFIAL